MKSRTGKLYLRFFDKEQDEAIDLEILPIPEESHEDDYYTWIKIEITPHGHCYKVLVDEGYVATYYYYPVERFMILRLETWEGEN